jgi:hypothetical protein
MFAFILKFTISEICAQTSQDSSGNGCSRHRHIIEFNNETGMLKNLWKGESYRRSFKCVQNSPVSLIFEDEDNFEFNLAGTRIAQ